MRACTFDTESDGLLEEATTIWCACIKDHKTGEVKSYSPLDGDGYLDRFIKDLNEYDVAIGHNSIGHDFPLLRKIAGALFPNLKKVDTLLMSRVQRPHRKVPPHAPSGIGPHSVEAWGWRLGRGKVQHEDWSKFTSAMLHRCEEDVEIQYLIYKALLKEGENENWTECHNLNFKLFELLQRQEEYGWLFDSDLAKYCIDFLDRRIDRIDRVTKSKLPLLCIPQENKVKGEYNYVRKPFKKSGNLAAIAERFLEGYTNNGIKPPSGIIGGPFSRISFRPVDLESNAEAKDYLLSLGWIPSQWNTNNKGERTSPKLNKDEEFEGIEGSLGKLIAKRFQCKSRKSILEGLLKLVREDGRIAARVTGLANTYRAKHAGVVNIPSSGAFFGSWMRRCFIARPGWVLVGTDSAGNQARQLAARMGDDEFTQAVLYGKSSDGTDFHSVNARKTGLTRPKAKNFFYAFIFGVGNSKLGRMLGNIGTDAAKKVRERYLKELPGLSNLLERGSAEWKKTAIKVYNPTFKQMEYRDGWLTALDGRPMQVESEHKILGYYLQSDEAIQMAAAYCIWHKWMEQEGYVFGKDYGTVCWYHDEYTFECRPDIAEKACRLSEESIGWAGRYYNIPVPHEGQGKIGANWYEIH